MAIRFKKSFESEESWYQSNNYGGKQLIMWSISLILIGVLASFLPIKGNGVLTTLIACAPLIALVPAMSGCGINVVCLVEAAGWSAARLKPDTEPAADRPENIHGLVLVC